MEHNDCLNLILSHINNKSFEYKNLALSPVSIEILLALLTKGASYGETQTKLLNSIHPECLSIFELDNYLSQTISALSSSPLILTTASILSTDNSLTEHFKFDCNEYQILTSKKLTALELNEWCATKTNGLITDVFSSNTEQYDFILVNVLYFKGSWLNAFTTTTQDIFYNSLGKKLKCSMMSVYNKFRVNINEEYEAVVLNYKETTKIKALCVMPSTQTIDEFINGLSAHQIKDIVNQCVEMCIKVNLPKFEIETFIDVSSAFGKELFTGEFGNMFDEVNAYKQIELKQKCIIKVDEHGTTACSVSYAGGKKGRIKSITFNTSFAFIIYHIDIEDNILFLGKVEKPL
jgi:serpin B